jgi:hypothetical protein
MAKTPMDWSTGAPLRNASAPRLTPQACRWGESTLNTTFPEWLSAWDAPWSCRHPAHTGPLETIETCATCPDWRPREPSK